MPRRPIAGLKYFNSEKKRLAKEQKALANAKIVLYHAQSHCKFGSNPDNTIREPTQADIDAAQILKELRESFK